MSNSINVSPRQISLSDIKRGEIFWECEYGINVMYKAITNPFVCDEGRTTLYAKCLGAHDVIFDSVSKNLFTIKVESDFDDVVEPTKFSAAEKYAFYLKVYKSPQYFKAV